VQSHLPPLPKFEFLTWISFAATVHEFGTPEYATFIDPATRQPSSRSVILIHVWKVGTVSLFYPLFSLHQADFHAFPPSQSCGWGVPLFEFQGERTTHPRWAVQTQNRDFDYETKKGGPSEVKETEYPEKGIRYYQALVNQKSLDGLPGLEVAFKTPLTSVVKQRIQPIVQPSTLSKVRKEQREKECRAKPVEAGDAVIWAKTDYLKKVEEAKFILLAFFFGLIVAACLPLGSNLARTDNSMLGLAFPFPSSS